MLDIFLSLFHAPHCLPLLNLIPQSGLRGWGVEHRGRVAET